MWALIASTSTDAVVVPLGAAIGAMVTALGLFAALAGWTLTTISKLAKEEQVKQINEKVHDIDRRLIKMETRIDFTSPPAAQTQPAE